jgi:hypothetical protein
MSKDYKKFFKAVEDSRVQAYYLGEVCNFEVEGLYQAFKARLIDELVADIKDCSTCANLTERDDQD